jgi:DNA-binding HxlR family transcriptional regulator
MKKEHGCTKNLRPIGDTLEVVGGKWKLLILSAFVNGETKRFRELQRELGNITPRMLSKELKDLEMHQLIERKVFDTSPVVVEYQISEYGKTLDSVMVALRDWGIKHRERIMIDSNPITEAMAS